MSTSIELDPRVSEQLHTSENEKLREKALQETLFDKQATKVLLTSKLRDLEESERQVVALCAVARAQLQEAHDEERSLFATVDGGAHRVDEANSHVYQKRVHLALLRARVALRHEDIAHERESLLRQRIIAEQANSVAKLQNDELGVHACARITQIAKAEQENSKIQAAIKQLMSNLELLQKSYNDASLGAIRWREDATNVDRRAAEMNELRRLRDKLAIEVRRDELVVRALKLRLRLVRENNEAPGCADTQCQEQELHHLTNTLLGLQRQIRECDDQRLPEQRDFQRAVDATYLDLWLMVQQHPMVRPVIEQRLRDKKLPPLPTRLPVWLLPPLPPSPESSTSTSGTVQAGCSPELSSSREPRGAEALQSEPSDLSQIPPPSLLTSDPQTLASPGFVYQTPKRGSSLPGKISDSKLHITSENERMVMSDAMLCQGMRCTLCTTRICKSCFI